MDPECLGVATSLARVLPISSSSKFILFLRCHPCLICLQLILVSLPNFVLPPPNMTQTLCGKTCYSSPQNST